MEIIDEIIKRARNLNLDQQEEILAILKSWQTGRQRDYPRLDTKVGIDVAIGDRVIQTVAKDISASGIFINASGKAEVNEKVRVVFSVPGVDQPFKLRGIIVRVEQDGIAIKFDESTSYFKKCLNDFIWENRE